MYRFSYLSTKDIIRVNPSCFPRLRKLRRERTHLHTPLQKPVLLRLRLAASEKPVLNAPASACVAELEKGARHGTDNAAPRAATRRLWRRHHQQPARPRTLVSGPYPQWKRARDLRKGPPHYPAGTDAGRFCDAKGVLV